MRGQLRGTPRTIDQSLDHLAERATRDIAPDAVRAGIHHAFVVGAILPTEIGLAEITNFGPGGPSEPPATTFQIGKVAALGQGFVTVAGSGRAGVTDADLQVLGRMARRRPKRASDYSTYRCCSGWI
jgi:hypothetical protein